MRGEDNRGQRGDGRRGIIPAGAGRSRHVPSGGVGLGDHPRGCGEKGRSPLSVVLVQGSSPRVRGEGSSGAMSRSRVRIIPAGAGRSHHASLVFLSRWDHPRGCGEKHCRPRPWADGPGSSPRVRGEVALWPFIASAAGIIPAGAGRSRGARRPGGDSGDHPRGCGEKLASRGVAVGIGGSSPRVRGEAWVASPACLGVGIIPAGAGRRRRSIRRRSLARDHPRGCGEKAARGPRLGPWRGSSPRVRGEVSSAAALAASAGIIPAGAGRRRGEGPRRPVGWDHPRGCGEKSSSSLASVALGGSSPRVRGEAADRRRASAPRRIIPAGAGRSSSAPIEKLRHRDHPRGCGEKMNAYSSSRRVRGSSPRVRGEAVLVHGVGRGRGIIPAGAGRRLEKV